MQWSNYTFLNTVWPKPVLSYAQPFTHREAALESDFILVRTHQYGIVSCKGFREKNQTAVYSVVNLNPSPIQHRYKGVARGGPGVPMTPPL